jgi:hypothetical protein
MQPRLNLAAPRSSIPPMNFQTATAERVASTSQRALLLYWQRLAGQRPYPAPAEFSPAERIHDPKQLVIWQVEPRGPKRRFRAIYHGAHVAEVFGQSWAGRTMDEVVPPFALPFALHSADACALTGRAVYTIFRTRDGQDRTIDCERLLLPLGTGGTVEQIVASLQLISLQGEFRRDTVLQAFDANIDVAFAGVISGVRQG